MNHRLVAARDAHIAVREWGAPCARPPVVLVHGLASNSLLWSGAASELARLGHHVVACDLRGHGLSSKPDGGYDIPNVADDIAALIAALGLHQPVVAGQSWGGNVVVELAFRHPHAIRGVCCVDGGLFSLSKCFSSWDECADVLKPPRLTGMPAQQYERMIRGAYPGFPESAITGFLANMQHHADGSISPWLTLDRHMLVLRGLWEHSPHDILPLIQRPILFTFADAGDPRFMPQPLDYQRAASQNHRVRVECFSPAHHDLHAQYPERWAAVLSGCIDDGFFA
jgi:pimeloyl-ACP methyl ester carboxylesterase